MGYKVIQWATGSMGKTCLRAIIDHPELELVGIYVYNPDKVGKDAGQIARRPTTGVLATNDIDAILALDADVVLHTPQIAASYARHNDDICRLLASGKNVASINGHSYPQHWDKVYLQAFTDACKQGNSTLYGSGLNPGFITDRIATVATSICLEIEHIEVTEIIDCTVMQNPDYVFGSLGFGAPCDNQDPNDPEWGPAEILNGMYAEVVAHLAQRLGYSLDRVETEHVMYPATQELNVSAGIIKQGTASHTHWRWHGIAQGKRVITQSIHWIMESAHLESPDYKLWGIRIKGLPGLNISIELDVPNGHPYKTTPEQYGVAGSLLNAIPGLIAAPAGIRELCVEDLYQEPNRAEQHR